MNSMFTDRVKRVMAIAREESQRLGNDYVGTEHLLIGLLKEGNGVGFSVLKELNIDTTNMIKKIEDSISTDGGMITDGKMLPFTPRAKKILEYAATEARNMSHKYIGTEHLLLSLIHDVESQAAAILLTEGLEYDKIKDSTRGILSGDAGAKTKKGGPKRSKTPFLDKFGRNLNEQALAGKLDPVIGREKEIERIIQILSRRKKNNPLLIGEPGIGKTAIIEGLAQKIVDREIPQVLEDKIVFNLDISSMVAGTKYRGQFEERMKSLITELGKNDDVIIFIDEIHTMVGAGGSEGSLDASNIFKPALARGEIQCIGATTLDEYRKYFESDGALDRRFQTIMVEPPSVSETIQIISGLQKSYEDHHKVTYTEKAIEDAVKLSERYISDRFLPDKAIDIIDEAGALIRLSGLEVPKEIRETELNLEDAITKKDAAVAEQNFEDAAYYRDKQDNLIVDLERKKEDWRATIAEQRLIVNEETISKVISSITGIPLTSLEENEAKRLLKLEDRLRKRVIGQEKALASISRSIRRSRAGLNNGKRPIASFIFLGPTGVGKTELAKALAVELFNNEDALIRLDMSEYMEKHAASRLVGAPPGYVGYEEGGQLTEKVRKKPYSVILFDEVEKAHPDVFNTLLQILDDGVATDSLGRKINFRNTIIIMTSNAGTREASKGGLGFTRSDSTTSYNIMKSKVLEELKKHFSPEFLNRIDETLVFRNLEREDIRQIVTIRLDEVKERLAEKSISLSFTDKAVEFILDKGFDSELGARPLQRAIQRNVEDLLAERFLQSEFVEGDTLTVDLATDELTVIKESGGINLHKDSETADM